MSDGLDLRHDVLDAQLVDRNKENIGRCDALILELRDGEPPRVSAVLIGGPARRERMGRWMVLLMRLVRGGRRDAGAMSRIPFAAMQSVGNTVQMNVLRDDLPSEHLEQWLAKHVISRIPGARRKQESRQ